MPRSVTYKSVLDRIASYLGEADGLDVEDKALAEAKINLFIRLGWEHFFHPDSMTVEQRTFRPTYDPAVAYAAPTATVPVEVYFPATGSYYQALQATNNNAPATLSGSQWTENSAFWAQSCGSYSANDWAPIAYSVGDQVRNPADDREYQCCTAHTGVGSFDSTMFGVLTPFLRSLDYEQAGQTPLGAVRFIWESDPRRASLGGYSPNQARFRLWADFVQVLGVANVIWPEFQGRAPVFSGATRADDTSYPAGVTLYDSPTGDYWTTLGVTTPGDSPTTIPGNWEKVVMPYYLAEFVAQSAYAALTDREQEQPENFTVGEAAGYPLLAAEMDRIERMQGQVRQLRIAGMC